MSIFLLHTLNASMLLGARLDLFKIIILCPFTLQACVTVAYKSMQLKVREISEIVRLGCTRALGLSDLLPLFCTPSFD